MTAADELWLRRVPTVDRLVKATRDELHAWHSVQIFTGMPWKESFVRRVISKVRDIDAGINDCSFDGEAMDGYMSLSDNIAKALRIDYNFDGTLASLLGRLTNPSGYIWRMRGLCAKHLQETHVMIRDLAQRKARIAIILEDDTKKKIKALHKVELKPSRMDIHYFAWTMLMEQDNVRPLEYAAILCEELSNGDPVRCASLCERISELMRDACGVCDDMTPEEVQRAVHLAQLRGIQPMIEEQRLKLIDRLGERVWDILPFVDEYGGEFTRPHEVELRHLVYHSKELQLTRAESALLNQLYDARNDLSHLKNLSEDTILALAGLSD